MSKHASTCPQSASGPGRLRRDVLTALAAAPTLLVSRGVQAAGHLTPPDDLRVLDWRFEGDKPFVKRALVLAPRHLPPGEKVPTLVLFHGLGEAKEGHESGTYAWLDRYGVASCYARLRHPPVATIDKRRDLTAARAAELNAELTARPFGGLVLVCPFTPNVWSFRDTPAALDALASFVAGPLLDRVGAEVPEADVSPARCGVDGCSLGGFVSLEVWQRQPARFGALGVVQPAIGHRHIPGYVAAIKKRAGLAVHVESSQADPYLLVSRDFHTALSQAGVTANFIAPPGPHDQLFLRDVGSLELLLWHDRALRRGEPLR